MIVCKKESNQQYFLLSSKESIVNLYCDCKDFWGVQRAVKDLQKDFNRVTTKTPKLFHKMDKISKQVVIIGTIGKSPLIDHLIKTAKINLDDIKGKWESFVIQVVNSPMEGIEQALVIAGSDRRGTIFGVYHLSQEIGVSPWYWWADVPVKKSDQLLLKSDRYKFGEPSVKFRGIFLNDEFPSLSCWVHKNYGENYNHHFYERVFELILRLKANYLWPAMWKPRMFNEEDPLNPVYADKYGIVMGTSHHEPMMRSWVEWELKGNGDWNYYTNRENLYDFWEKGVKRVKDYEGTVTVGMRGDGDEAMIEGGTVEENKNLLEKIISDQRKIIEDKFDKKASDVPQILALYKEVQNFYEAGMEIPEDITLMLADDNFGNIRKLPSKKDRSRIGGYGMYYHFDYVGGPRSYQWINTVPLQKIWNQMKMTYDYGVYRVWIVNVGDLKPMELPISFFLEIAWDIYKWKEDNISLFVLKWVKEQFGNNYAEDIADIIKKYTKHNGIRKPEIVYENTFSLLNYREAERVLSELNQAVEKAEKIYDSLEDIKKDAFFQLVLYPIRASRNILKMHVFAGLNQLYAIQGRAMANDYAKLTEKTFNDESEDTRYYNEEMSSGKWNLMMIQPHIGKSNWRGPEDNYMPEVKTITLTAGSQMALSVEGSSKTWTDDGSTCNLPEFSVYTDEKHYFELFNKKSDSFEYKLEKSEPWIILSQTSGKIIKQERIEVEIDWSNAPKGESITSSITVQGNNKNFYINIKISNPDEPSIDSLPKMTFIESKGYISIEAKHFKESTKANDAKWVNVPDYGRTLSSMITLPFTSNSFSPSENSPTLEYGVYISNPGKIKVMVYTAPSLNVNRDRGLKFAIGFDLEEKKIVDTFPKTFDATEEYPLWSEGVMNNVRIYESIHNIEKAGYHTLKISMIDPGIVIQKIVLDMGGVMPSYLGPPESFYKK
ncbi:glycosyl hydrolase 115 family protein [Herbivorax sp. ANBcel31]|uniref:glycosyl hydrolase 115 family protein n=1 Tax=Herbivorax sp. ANBcel31 TaxID=3069754 RepID=UPI0027AE8B8A|nr:glycosyl hydrolase 115 family protein [Herbivorax sp. ANBcel31]MDQ2086476.1 glycosyl hydrolase 115 family protein [Herbivorax sp. ANBcel31]